VCVCVCVCVCVRVCVCVCVCVCVNGAGLDAKSAPKEGIRECAEDATREPHVQREAQDNRAAERGEDLPPGPRAHASSSPRLTRQSCATYAVICVAMPSLAGNLPAASRTAAAIARHTVFGPSQVPGLTPNAADTRRRLCTENGHSGAS
jgi:hypothetical protein